MHQPLHAAGYYLNPEFYYTNLDIESDQEVIKGLYTCIEKMVPSQAEQDRIADQIPLYRNADNLFGISMARRQRSSKSPGYIIIRKAPSTLLNLFHTIDNSILMFIVLIFQRSGGSLTVDVRLIYKNLQSKSLVSLAAHPDANEIGAHFSM